MFYKKIKLLSFLIICLTIAAVTGGFSYWIFAESSSAATTNQNIGTGGTSQDDKPAQSDGIYENYSFSKNEIGDKYEFYFFPSTLYLELYNNGYKKPENAFGYNEVQFNDKAEPLINENGLTKYEVIGDDQSEAEHRTGISLNGNNEIVTSTTDNSIKTYYDFMMKDTNASYLNRGAQESSGKGYPVFEIGDGGDDDIAYSPIYGKRKNWD